VDGDPLRLRQVFWNLVSNAVKFTPTRGQVVVRSWNNRGTLAIEIADSGIGLDSEARERIFLPFEQARPNAGAGLGLGLAIAKGIVDLHGGQISVASAGVGQGTRFVVELSVLAGSATQPMPAIATEPRGVPEDVHLPPPAVAPAPLPSPPPAAPAAPTRILLVDDNPDVLRAMGRLLQIEGYSVTLAASARDAMNVDLAQIDLVLSDIGLPDMTGWDLIRALGRKHHLTAIAFTGYGTENDARLSEEAGFAAHLVKPVDLSELISTIQRVMAKRAPPEPVEEKALSSDRSRARRRSSAD
jgi:CheY-like chemotaxis protein